MTSRAETDKHVADKNAETEALRINHDVQLATLAHQHANLSLKAGLVIQLTGATIFTGVVIGGFMTGHMDVVTHAVGVAAGLLGGYGLGRTQKPISEDRLEK